MMDMPIDRIKSLNLKKNPFLDNDYFLKRKEEHRKSRQQAYLKSTAARNGYYALQMRERNAVKVARSVLRGGMGSNVHLLPDYLYPNIEKRKLFGQLKFDIREILSTLCRYKGVEIIEGAVCRSRAYVRKYPS